MRPSQWMVVVFWALAVCLPAAAHDALPVTLRLDQTGPDAYTLRTQYPPGAVQGNTPLIHLSPCAQVSGDAVRLHFECPAGLAPASLELETEGRFRRSPIILRIRFLDGQQHVLAAPPGQLRLDLPDKETPQRIAKDYVRIGLHHILSGLDHLLFLVCIVLIATTPRRLVWTVSGFTLGHALTICLTSLGRIQVNAAAIEVLIALSIVFAASEVARGRRDTLSWRRPGLVASLFGLLHGLGFAGALSEIGLPQSEIPLALLAFNLGIEIGQLAFVAVLLVVLQTAARLAPAVRWAPPVGSMLSWPIGILTGCFVFERLLG